MMWTPTARVEVRVVIISSHGEDADTDSERGDDGGDHHQQWR